MRSVARIIGIVCLMLGVIFVSCVATKENVNSDIKIYKDKNGGKVFTRVKGVEDLKDPNCFSIYGEDDIFSKDGRILEYKTVYSVLITDDGKFIDINFLYATDEQDSFYVMKNGKIKRYYAYNKEFTVCHVGTYEGEFFYTKNIDDDSESVFLVLYDDEHQYKKVTEPNSVFESQGFEISQSGKLQKTKKEELICDTYWKNGEDEMIYIDEKTFYWVWANGGFMPTDYKVVYSDERFKLFITYFPYYYGMISFNTAINIRYYLLKEDGTLYKLAGPLKEVTDSDGYIVNILRDMNQ